MTISGMFVHLSAIRRFLETWCRELCPVVHRNQPGKGSADSLALNYQFLLSSIALAGTPFVRDSTCS